MTVKVGQPMPTSIPGLGSQLHLTRDHLRSRLGVADSEIASVISPYRICPVGGHIDHQGGTVLGMAISAYTVLAFAPSRDASATVCSPHLPDQVDFDMRDPGDADKGHWGGYARGSAAMLGALLPAEPRGFRGSVVGTLPGGGLGSSASVDLAYLSAYAAVNHLELSPRELAVGAMRVETEYMGLQCGLLDPVSITASRRGHLVRIDCREESWEAIPPADNMPAYRIVIAFSGSSRSLADTGFNRRVDECRRAAQLVAAQSGREPVGRLGDLPVEVIEEHLDRLPATMGRRARHFIGESRRVREALAAWRSGDLATLGELMNASCSSSIENYECGSPELIDLHRILRDCPGVLGNRFIGGGYGGCCVALAETERAEEVLTCAEAAYLKKYPDLRERARFFPVDPEDGLRFA